MKTKEEQIFDQINKASNILITGYAPWNEEMITNALALRLFLKKLNKEVEIIIENGEAFNFIKPTRENFSIFSGFETIKSRSDLSRDVTIYVDIYEVQLEKIKYKIDNSHLKFFLNLSKGKLTSDNITTENDSFKYDLVFILNTPDLELLGNFYKENSDFFYNTPVINIDNQASNEEYGQINLVNITSTSVAEILYSLFLAYSPDSIDSELATILLGGIIYKTKNFKTLVTPNVLNITSQLISLGGDKEKIINKFYQSRKINSLKLWGKALNNLASLRGLDNKLIWTELTENDFADTETSETDLIDLINEIVIHIPKVNVVAVFYQKKEDKKLDEKTNYFLIYSHKNISLKNQLIQFSPQGNEKILQGKTTKKMEDTKKEVIASLLGEIKKLD